MVIHVVRSGDTVWALSRRYNVSPERITQVNGLQDIPHLVVGQALVIPSEERTYIVRPGDTLWSIARRYNVSATSLQSYNGITDPARLSVGQVIRIPAQEQRYGYIEVNGYIEPSTPENDRRIIDDVGRFHTYISPFSYRVRADGSLFPLNDTDIIQAARQYRAASLMVITNFAGGTFDSTLAMAILTNTGVQDTLIGNIVRIMQQKGYYGLNIDFERVPPENREDYNAFLRKITARLHQLNYVVSTALAPKLSAEQVGAWYEAHDYPAHGQIVDFVILMTYEWGWSGGPPMAVAPINQVRAVLDYAVSVIPRNKIMMGMPLYGYDWTLPYRPGNPFARRVSPQQAYQRAAQYNASVQYDIPSQSPFINYTDDQGRRHVIWFEDARSAQAKFLLASEMGLRGVSYWVLGSDFPQNWAVLNDMFKIVKVI